MEFCAVCSNDLVCADQGECFKRVAAAIPFELANLRIDPLLSVLSCSFSADIIMCGKKVAEAYGSGDGQMSIIIPTQEGEGLPRLLPELVELRVNEAVARMEFNRLAAFHGCVLACGRIVFTLPCNTRRLARALRGREMDLKDNKELEEAWLYFSKTKCQEKQK